MLTGTLVNVVLVILGSIIGLIGKRGIPKRFEELVMSSIGLVTIIIGITYAIESNNILIVIVSLVIGGIIGEAIDIDKFLNSMGEKVQKRFASSETDIVQGMITATLIFCVGSMTIMGALDSGIRGDHTILYTKSIMDGIGAIFFASSMGIGVLFSAIPLFIYQSVLTLGASLLEPFLYAELLVEVNAVGGILLMGLGLSLLNIKRIKVANLLPALIIPCIILSII